MKTRSISVNDGFNFAFWEHGTSAVSSDVPVVMLHSLFFGHGMFADIVHRLGNARKIFTPDFRGQGASTATSAEPSMRQLADDVIALITSEVDGPVHLVGSSMGGYVAQDLVLRRPDLVVSCVLSCCTAQAEAEPERFAALEHRVRSEGPSTMVEDLMGVMFGQNFLHKGAQVELARWRAHFASLPRDVADAVHGVFSRPSYLEQLKDVRVPMLLISGALDRAKRPADMEQISKQVADGQHLIFNYSGHTPPIEESERFATELESFWRAVDARAAQA